jgi:hypothetical protein
MKTAWSMEVKYVTWIGKALKMSFVATMEAATARQNTRTMTYLCWLSVSQDVEVHEVLFEIYIPHRPFWLVRYMSFIGVKLLEQQTKDW